LSTIAALFSRILQEPWSKQPPAPTSFLLSAGFPRFASAAARAQGCARTGRAARRPRPRAETRCDVSSVFRESRRWAVSSILLWCPCRELCASEGRVQVSSPWGWSLSRTVRCSREQLRVPFCAWRCLMLACLC
jgi:hypothetical protein